MERTGAELIVESLKAEGVKVLFGLPGSENLPIMDILYDTPDIRFIQSQHEQGAIFMANGYAAASRQPAVTLVSPGPGATNCVSGVTQAYYSSIPSILICIREDSLYSGQGTSQHHDLEATRVFAPVTKRSIEIQRVERMREHLQDAFRVALADRKGSCFISIPRNLLVAKTDDQAATHPRFPIPLTRGNAQDIDRAARLLTGAKRPVILAGGGVIAAEACQELQELAEFLSAPVGTTAGHNGIIPEDHPLSVGPCFSSRPLPAAKAFREADLVLTVGCTFTYFGTGFYNRPGLPLPNGAKMVQIDSDPAIIDKVYPVDAAVVGDAKLVLQDLLRSFKENNHAPTRESPWLKTVLQYKQEWEKETAPLRNSNEVPIRNWRLMSDLRKALPRDAMVGGSGGSTHAWFEHTFQSLVPNTVGGWNPMGGDFCGAMGAKLAKPDRVVVTVTGDGSMMMTLPEMATAVANDIPILCVVRHNRIFGNMRHTQVTRYKGRFSGTDLPIPNLANIAREFGAYGETVEEPAQIIPAVTRALESGKPALLDFVVNSSPEELMPPEFSIAREREALS